MFKINIDINKTFDYRASEIKKIIFKVKRLYILVFLSMYNYKKRLFVFRPIYRHVYYRITSIKILKSEARYIEFFYFLFDHQNC